MPPAGIVRLALQAFRSYETFECSFSKPHCIALIGPNGIGKTNLLEALSLLTPGRGLKRSPSREIQAEHLPHIPWGISATFETPSGPVEIFTGRSSVDTEKRLSKISSVPVKTQADLGNHAYALWLTPQMDGLFREGESARRRFLDRLVLGLYPAHGSHVSRYEKALRERHRLFEEPNAPPSWFEGIEKSLAIEGIEIVKTRLLFLEKMQKMLAEPQGPFPQASLFLEGELETLLQQHTEQETLKIFEDFLKTQRQLHQKMGQTPWGAHKSRLRTFFPGDIPAEKSSTGQQKILLISLILAACRLQFTKASEDRSFLLLLDDVTAHLDATHRHALFQTLSSLPLQVWVTGTEVSSLEGYVAEILILAPELMNPSSDAVPN